MSRAKPRFQCIFMIMIVITVRHERSTRSSQWSTIRAFPTSDMLIFSVGYDYHDYYQLGDDWEHCYCSGVRRGGDGGDDAGSGKNNIENITFGENN